MDLIKKTTKLSHVQQSNGLHNLIAHSHGHHHMTNLSLNSGAYPSVSLDSFVIKLKITSHTARASNSHILIAKTDQSYIQSILHTIKYSNSFKISSIGTIFSFDVKNLTIFLRCLSDIQPKTFGKIANITPPSKTILK